MKSQTPTLRWPDTKRAQLQTKIDKAASKMQTMLAEASKLDGESLIECCSCGSMYPINTQTYIQTHWYTRPNGCTGGDYWNQGEANWVCPHCKFVNRFEDNVNKYATMANDFHRPELVKLKYRFGKVVDCYCEYGNVCSECKKNGIK